MSNDVKHERVDVNTNFENSIGWNVDIKNRIIRINEDIESKTFDTVDAGLTELESISKKTITIRICSLGGSVYDALAIIGRIERSKCKIITEGYGCIMSAATAILAAGDERKMSKRAWFMHHEASYVVEGKHTAVVSYVEQQHREEIAWAELMEELTCVGKEFWLENGKTEDKYFSPQECLNLNIIDDIF
jgi:ATP-dependent protease ClpP protease subunit